MVWIVDAVIRQACKDVRFSVGAENDNEGARMTRWERGWQLRYKVIRRDNCPAFVVFQGFFIVRRSVPYRHPER